MCPNPPDKFRRNMGRLNSAQLVEAAQRRNWHPQGDVNEQWNLISANLMELLDTYAPLKRIRRRGTPPWWKARARKAQATKLRAWQKYRNCKSHRKLLEYIRARNKAKSVQLDCRRKYEERLAKGAKKNPKAYFNYVQAKSNQRVTVGNVKSTSGETANTNEEKAEILRQYFETAHTIDIGRRLKETYSLNTTEMQPVAFEEDNVRNELAKLQPN